MSNRLAAESSPYLLQHAENPVDWYPWGEEAFAEARRRDVPVFISVGYSTCYWCHVMERQSFENADIAALMNERFVCVKVDREERPDVDQLYMTAVQVQTGQGGWPMSVWLLPDGRPFYGGTYFPPTDAHGRPGFPTVLRALSEHYRDNRSELEANAAQLEQILQRLAEPTGPDASFTLDADLLGQLETASRSDFEPRFGGFGSAPKFPRQTLLETLLQFERSEPNEQRASQLKQTLDAMAAGGIRDQLRGGFHRYSTDAKWLVPHFEIMLYDQGMLLHNYADAADVFDDDGYRAVARRLADFVLRDMTSPDGAFYTALDAEVDAVEGDPYVWTADQVREALGGDADEFLAAYGLSDGPNFHDPHGPSAVDTHNVLYVAGDFREAEARFAAQREVLPAVRNRRKQPMLDTKVIASWNALMIRGLAKAGAVLGEARYLDAAATAAAFLLEKHRTDDGGLWRTSRDGSPKHAGFLDDYAFLADALLDLAEATGNEKHRDAATDLHQQTVERFADGDRGFFFTAGDELIVRQKTGTDSPLPAGVAVAGRVALRLGETDRAAGVVRTFAEPLRNHPGGMSSLLSLALHHGEPIAVDVAANDRPPTPQDIAEQAVQVRGEWRGEQELLVTLRVSDGYHIHATDPGDGLIGTALNATNVAASITFPEPTEATFAFADTSLRVFAGEVPVTISFAEPPTAPVEMVLRYQACDDSACLPPVTRSLRVQVPCGDNGCDDDHCGCKE